MDIADKEDNLRMAKQAYLNSVAGNKLVSGTPDKPKKIGTYTPDEMLSMMYGMNPKQNTFHKKINAYLESTGAKNLTKSDK